MPGSTHHIVTDAREAQLATVEDMERMTGAFMDALDNLRKDGAKHSTDWGELHDEHHRWVQAQIDRDNARARFWMSLAEKSLPAILATLLLAAAGAIWSLVSNHVTWSK